MLVANPFVYEKTMLADIKSATIPFMLEEHYGQCGEDLIVFSILRSLRTQNLLSDWTNFCCIEIGANHAFAGSNSYLLWKYTGVPCILVEANPKLLPDLHKARPDVQLVHTAIVTDDAEHVEFFVSHHHELSSLNRDFVEKWHDGNVGVEEVINVPAMRINRFLEQYVPENRQIVLLSVDIEGMDLEIIEDMDFEKWRPIIVQMEPSNHFHADESVKMTVAMQKRGYVLLSETNVNLIFIEQAVFSRFLLPLSGNVAQETQKPLSESDEAVG